MSDGEMQVSAKGGTLIKRWLEAQQGLQRQREHLNSAQTAFLNATEELAKWMLPEDAEPGEKICVWFGDSLVQVELAVNEGRTGTRPVVTIRKRGRELYRFI